MGTATVPGLAFIYGNPADADEAYRIAVSPIVEGRLPPTHIEFNRSADSNNAKFVFKVQGRESDLNVEIDDFSWSHVELLRSALGRVLYFFIIFGYVVEGGSIELLDPTENVLFKNLLEIDGELISGQRVDEVDWNNVFGEDAQILLGSLEA
jgi:hypothetical protein